MLRLLRAAHVIPMSGAQHVSFPAHLPGRGSTAVDAEASNTALERTAGSPSLAAAAHRQRSAAAATSSGLRYHPQVGLVTDKETRLYELVVPLAQDG